MNEMQYQLGAMFTGEPNPTITFLCVSSSNPLAALAVDQPFDYCLLKKGNGGTQSVPFWIYDSMGNRKENITDWALRKFVARYKQDSGKKDETKRITKEAIFHYCYAVLHDPAYISKYAVNLKREFPHIPYYENFWKWAEWGKTLFELHLGYESVEPFPLKRTDTPDEKARAARQSPKPILRADKEVGNIRIDSETTLVGIPPDAWAYQLGNRSALEWVLDQYKEKKVKDSTLRDHFNTYRFSDHKEQVIELLKRVASVSISTVFVIHQMKAESQ